MRDEAIIRRFKGAVQLVTLHLWRVGKTTDIDECITCAKNLGMIDDDNEAFIRNCIDLNTKISDGSTDSPPDTATDTINDELIHELQMCAIRLNSADPA